MRLRYLIPPGNFLSVSRKMIPHMNAYIHFSFAFTRSGAVHFIASNNDSGVRDYDMERFQLCKHFQFEWPVNVSYFGFFHISFSQCSVWTISLLPSLLKMFFFVHAWLSKSLCRDSVSFFIVLFMLICFSLIKMSTFFFFLTMIILSTF
jgi:hypothetical protein